MSKRQKAKQKGNVLLLKMPCLLINWAFSRATSDPFWRTEKLCHIYFDSLKGKIVTNINLSDYLYSVFAFFFAITWRVWDINSAEKWEQQGGRNVVRWEFKLFDKFKFHIACVNFNNLLNVAICFVVVSPWIRLFGSPDENEVLRGKFILEVRLFYRYHNVCLRLAINSPNLIENCLLSLPLLPWYTL